MASEETSEEEGGSGLGGTLLYDRAFCDTDSVHVNCGGCHCDKCHHQAESKINLNIHNKIFHDNYIIPQYDGNFIYINRRI